MTTARTSPHRRRQRRPYLPVIGCAALCLLFVLAVVAAAFIPVMAARTFGLPSENLGWLQIFQYSARLLWYDGLLTRPAEPLATVERKFTIEPGESPVSISVRLEEDGLINDAGAFRAYLAYSGLDTGVQAGEFSLSPALASVQIAQKLQDATPTQIKFVILPGWRLEEIAATLPTSGLNITPEQFLALARAPGGNYDFLPASATAEGFLLPGEYIVPRVIQGKQLLPTLINNFALILTPEMRAGFARQGLDVYQAVTLASIVQREAVQADEQPIIASVFLNRLAAGMRLETDPTIQYALGFNVATNSWWKAPLSLDDLQIVSPYNTYQNPGLPPGPICNPALSALQAVAYPAQTPYYFFRARCDGSGTHLFAETYDQHLQNDCP